MASTVIDLSDLGDRGFAILGGAVGDLAGYTLSNLGDINADSYDDIAVGAIFADGEVGLNHGRAYILFGKSGGFAQIDLAHLAPADGFTITGAYKHDYASSSLSGSGDFNGDGIADIMVGASRSSAGAHQSGAAYVIFGKTDDFGPIDLGDLAPADGFAILGDRKKDAAGTSVALVGDLNGDGYADAVVGAPGVDRINSSGVGMTYVIFGKAEGFGTIDLAHLTRADGFTILGDQNGDDVGSGVTTAGDFNGDGYADLVVGSEGGVGLGRVYVVFGGADPASSIDLRELTPDMGFRITGDPREDYIGRAVGAGDFNADGYADVVIGSSNANANGTAYIVYGHADGVHDIDLTQLSPIDGVAILGEAQDDSFGSSVSAAGDVNGDGFDDVIIGAERNGDGGNFAGKAYVLFGRADGFANVDLTNLGVADGFMIQGDGLYDFAGTSVSSAGDINRDGFDDIMVGAPETHDRSGSGKAYVIFGMAPTESVTRVGTDIANTIHGGVGNDKLDGRGGDDTLISAEGNDKVLGRGGNDDLQGGDGKDKLDGGAGNDLLHGGTGQDRLSGGGGDDILYGGPDKDILSGGSGVDQFHFSLGGTAPDAATADTITDFSQSQHDVLDLTDYDANPGTKPDDPFTFIGVSAFSGATGELRYEFAGSDTLVSGDTNGDAVADFTIRLTGTITLAAADFLFAAPTTPAHSLLAHPDITANPMLHLA